MNPRPQAPGAKPSEQDPVDWRARSQGLEEALKHATFRLQEAFRFAENDQDAYAWDEIERARIALSLGLPDEEGQNDLGYGAAPPPRGAAHQSRDVDDLRADVQRSVGADGQGARTSHPAPEPSLGKRVLAAAIRGSRDRQEELAVMDFFSASAPKSTAPRARSAIKESPSSPSVRDITGEGETDVPCGWCGGEGAVRDADGKLGEDCPRCNARTRLRTGEQKR